jgi:chloramphenicol 3-O phosphotransferase
VTASYDVIVLNGTSSSGKSAIARCLQAVLPQPWLRTGIDVLLDTIPARLIRADDGIRFLPDGGIEVGPAFRQLHHAWRAGVAAAVRAGAPMIVDEVFLRGGAEQDEWRPRAVRFTHSVGRCAVRNRCRGRPRARSC